MASNVTDDSLVRYLLPPRTLKCFPASSITVTVTLSQDRYYPSDGFFNSFDFKETLRQDILDWLKQAGVEK